MSVKIISSLAIDTTFFCFLEDCEVNDGSSEKPYANRYTQKYFGKRIRKLREKHEHQMIAPSAPYRTDITEMR